MNYASRIAKANCKKGYAHFDSRVTYCQVQHLVECPEEVCRHGFYPLISTTLSRQIYHETAASYPGKEVERKDREIAYAAHIDHRIYQYYALLWSDLYESVLSETGVAGCVAAYRPGKGISNISTAARAIAKIRDLGDSFVITGDFKYFFFQVSFMCI